MVILVTLEIKIGEEAGMMNICIPYITIEPIISKLSSQFWFSSVRRSSTTQYMGTLKEKLSDVEMELIAEVGNMNVPIRDVLNLHIGDVIRFNTTKITDPLVLSVGSQKKFYCQPGVVGQKRAVQIIEKIKDNDDDEFEELTAEGEETL
jgi:flagellar motor switch protein FliM